MRAPTLRSWRLLFFASLFSSTVSATPAHSQLWGEHGEKWSASGRLPDFSFAGYHRGDAPIPTPAPSANVKDFGAVGDGLTDDTKAIQSAINATPRGAILLPPGRYKITDYLRVTKSGLVLRGAGPDKTILWFPTGLDAVHPKDGHTSTGAPASGYSFDGAFLTLEGDYRSTTLARITTTARRGDSEIQVDQTERIATGQLVLVAAQETPDQSLKTWLYNGDPGDIARGKQLDTKMLARVTAIHGNRIQLDRPLRFETRAAWQPVLRNFAPTVSESGVEDLGFEFPAERYLGHFKETGANALELRNVFNCWVRNISIHNADLGINIVACHNTIDGVTFTASTGRDIPVAGVPVTGHHALQCKRAEDNLVTNFNLRTSYVHDLSVEHASGNVFAHGGGTDINFDHHKDTPYENLYTDIDCGRGSRVWGSGGGASLGRQCAGWGTFWNIRATHPIAPPPHGWGAPTMNFVGLSDDVSSATESNAIWIEPIPPPQLQPADLHAAQLARRRSAPPAPTNAKTR